MIRGLPSLALACCILAPAAGAQAQDLPRQRLTFGLSVLADDNIDLMATDAGSVVQTALDLGFGLTRQSGTRHLELSGNASFLRESGEGARDRDLTLDQGDLSALYRMEGAGSLLQLDASFARTDLGTGTDLDGTGGRRDRERVGFLTEFGRDTRAVFGLRGSAMRDRVSDGAVDSLGTPLGDSRTYQLAALTRLDLSRVMLASFELGTTRYEPRIGESRDRAYLDGQLEIARPDGAVTFASRLEEAADGVILEAEAGRRYDLPGGALSLRAGATRSSDGDIYLSGSGLVRYDLPNGVLTGSASRSVDYADSSSSERLLTNVAVTARFELTDLLSASAGASFSRTEDLAGDETTDLTSLRAGLSYALSEDWQVNGDVTLRRKRLPSGEEARSNRVMLSVSRTFVSF